jgi:hypothetical protein
MMTIFMVYPPLSMAGDPLMDSNASEESGSRFSCHSAKVRFGGNACQSTKSM